MKSIAVSVLAVVLLLARPAAAEHSVLEKLNKTKVLTLGYEDAPPFSFTGDFGALTGYSVDLCTLIVEGFKTKDDDFPDEFEVKWEKTGIKAAERIEALTSGRIDLFCGDMTDTFERQKYIDFSNLIYVGGGAALVRDNSSIQTLKELHAKKIAVIPGTSNAKAFQDYVQRRHFVVTAVNVEDHEAGIKAVADGTADAYVTDRTVLANLLRKLETADDFRLLAQNISFEPIALGMRKEDTKFRRAVNRQLSRIIRTQEVIALAKKWLHTDNDRGEDDELLGFMYLLSTRPD